MSYSGLPKKVDTSDPVNEVVKKYLAEKYDRKIEYLEKEIQKLKTERQTEELKVKEEYNNCYAKYKSMIIEAFYNGQDSYRMEFDSQPYHTSGKGQWVKLDPMIESAMKIITVEFQRDGYEASFLPADRYCYSDEGQFGSSWYESYMLFTIKFR